VCVCVCVCVRECVRAHINAFLESLNTHEQGQQTRRPEGMLLSRALHKLCEDA
jgi:hypothetical protein